MDTNHNNLFHLQILQIYRKYKIRINNFLKNNQLQKLLLLWLQVSLIYLYNKDLAQVILNKIMIKKIKKKTIILNRVS